MPDAPVISEIRKDGDDALWQIKWFGAVEQLPHEACINVHLCRRLANGIDDWRVAKIGTGQLPYLTHGSIWHAGRRITNRAVGERLQLQGVRIETERLRLVRLNQDIGSTTEGRKLWLVPPFRYSLPKQVYWSYCLAIEHENDPFSILVPTMEVIRFYYALSTDLAQVMFRGLLQTSVRDVFDPTLSGSLEINGKRRMVIARSKHMSDNDCWILGRILGDHHARSGAEQIYDSLLMAAANRETPFAVSDFPFRGTVNWTVRAINIGTDKPRWLVLEIKRCNGAFPFDELEVVADNDSRKANPETDRPDNEKKIAFPMRPPSSALDPDDELQSKNAPAASMVPIILSNPGDCFDALVGKHIVKTDKEECQYKAGQLSSPFTDPGQDLGTGDGTYSDTPVKQGEVVWDTHDEEKERTRRKALEASFATLYEVVDEINKIEGASARVRESRATASIPLTAPRNQRQWSWLDSSKRVPREVMIVGVVAGDQAGCIVEFKKRDGESRAMGVLVSQGKDTPSDGELAYLLLALAKAQGVWKNVRTRATGVIIHPLSHTTPTTVELAQKIVQIIGDAGSLK